ncbi:uncharacterized protein FOMMEDRAFT_167420 [Fomitiporia mediterranea MF3/22]|uniref:uncharacterized protein n=1 Tax=Fomitiporia mediterranea (strain MF3/22) TaxID=694068 RepID=UPI00044083B6|nr:uncharacterized protein FOMMEDRAFT_167420 [Fomitiporia mediterranea MF3/22]EJD04180.1 hypothetical protein FOMMEDRAFT_167420 [Fomitiporia mediterranea MF3/22]
MSGSLRPLNSPFASPTRTQLSAFLPTLASRSISPLSAPFVTEPPALLPRASSCSATPNEVLVQLSTQVLIPDYSSFYTATPLAQFRPSYSTFPDGSLVADPYIAGVRRGDWTLLFSGMMLMLFIITSIVSADYIRRGRVKYKGLFYALLISQLCGVVSFALTAATVLATGINCRAALVASGLFTELSSAILLSGILGVKAYRCLNDSKAVLCIICVLQGVSSTMTFLDLANQNASRRLSLICTVTKDPIFFSLATTIRFVIALFICLCFIYALWKSEKLPAAQGRISIYLTSNTPPPPVTNEKEGSTAVRPRGWWDYVPETRPNANPSEMQQQSRAPTWHVVDDQGFVGNMRYLVGAWIKDGTSAENAKRKGSEATLVAPIQRSHRSKPSFVHFQDNSEQSRFSVASVPHSSTPSRTRSLGPLMTRMRLFREVMRNELAHTALITLFNVIATVLGLVGAFRSKSIDPEVFVGSYWGILSVLVIHSFGRVVERHEREAFLQHPSTWDSLYNVDKSDNGAAHQGPINESIPYNSNSWRTQPSAEPPAGASGNINARDAREEPSRNVSNASENPFEDFEFIVGSSNGANTSVARHECHLAPDQPPCSPGAESLLPDAPVLPLDLDRNPRISLIRWSDAPSRDSVSRYSDTSSRPRSLFYLEKN